MGGTGHGEGPGWTLKCVTEGGLPCSKGDKVNKSDKHVVQLLSPSIFTRDISRPFEEARNCVISFSLKNPASVKDVLERYSLSRTRPGLGLY